VVVLHPVTDDPARLVKRLKCVLPDALFFKTAKEPFDDTVLLRRVRRNEFLLELSGQADRGLGSFLDWNQIAQQSVAERVLSPLRSVFMASGSWSR
jgi:hypothetical protein